jgi:nucleoside-diphosphate-sugar epimerase
MSKDFLVTGYKGFIGSRVSGKPFKGRLENQEEIFKQAENVKGIIHLAGVGRKKDCEDNPVKCIQSNLVGLCNVLEVAKARNIWVLFASTYQIREKHLYGLTKLLGEELCRFYQKEGVKVKILRLPVVYGENDRPDKIVAKFISQIESGIEPRIDTDDKFFFMYVDDAANLIESEASILSGGFGKKYSLRDLTDGIKACLKNDGRKTKRKK